VAREKQLITDTLLYSASFRDDMVKFLGLSADHLRDLNSLADGPDGFRPSRQSTRFATKAAISADDARAALRVAEYLYEKCRDEAISLDAGVNELTQIASDLQVADVATKASELRDILAVKDGYESKRQAAAQAVATVAHFVGLEGTWDIRPVFNRETREVVATVPVLLLNLSWHDHGGTLHEAVVQLNDEEWGDLEEVVKRIRDNRDALGKHFSSEEW